MSNAKCCFRHFGAVNNVILLEKNACCGNIYRHIVKNKVIYQLQLKRKCLVEPWCLCTPITFLNLLLINAFFNTFTTKQRETFGIVAFNSLCGHFCFISLKHWFIFIFSLSICASCQFHQHPWTSVPSEMQDFKLNAGAKLDGPSPLNVSAFQEEFQILLVRLQDSFAVLARSICKWSVVQSIFGWKQTKKKDAKHSVSSVFDLLNFWDVLLPWNSKGDDILFKRHAFCCGWNTDQIWDYGILLTFYTWSRQFRSRGCKTGSFDSAAAISRAFAEMWHFVEITVFKVKSMDGYFSN